ncbi:MAG TPA: recombination protein NinB [Pyrinomonadaceae bacterium]|nr:recombination protein NinB [Pyrinomonadaceae bacterium]
MKKTLVLTGDRARQAACREIMSAPEGYVVTIGEQTRTNDQNAKLWPMLHDISTQVDWYGNRLSEDEWKDVFTASLKKQKVVPGIDGGFVVCGTRTSKMPKSEFSELIELITAFGVQKGVVWSEKPCETYPHVVK